MKPHIYDRKEVNATTKNYFDLEFSYYECKYNHICINIATLL